MARLKLFRSTSGIEDAYVAASSRAKALEAFGAKTDLFALGVASQIDDAALLAKASKQPGTIFRKRRDSSEIREAVRTAKRPQSSKANPKAKDATKLRSRLSTAEKVRDSELKKIDEELNFLTKRRAKAEAKHARIIEQLRGRLSSIASSKKPIKPDEGRRGLTETEG